jgi:hypothetical protein
MDTGAAALITGVLTFVVTGVGTYVTTYVKWRKDLLVEYDKDLRARRIDAYRELWRQLQPLAEYARPVHVTPAQLVEISINLRRWYFEVGGLFLSESSRDAYFALQTGIRETFKNYTERELAVVQEWLEEAPNNLFFNPPEQIVSSPPAPIANWHRELAETDHETLRRLGSALRTQMANDVKTRRPSQVND